MVEVPDVTGDSVDDAKTALEDAGFEVEEDRGLLGLFGDTVEEASPSRAARRARGLDDHHQDPGEPADCRAAARSARRRPRWPRAPARVTSSTPADRLAARGRAVLVANPRGWASPRPVIRRRTSSTPGRRRRPCAVRVRRGPARPCHAAVSRSRLPARLHRGDGRHEPYLVELRLAHLTATCAAAHGADRRAGSASVVAHRSATGGRRAAVALAQVREQLLPLLDELTHDDDPFLLLESTAGQGSSLCSRTWDFGPYFEALDAAPRSWASAWTPATSSRPATTWPARAACSRRSTCWWTRSARAG